jgi:hypothetical protein
MRHGTRNSSATPPLRRLALICATAAAAMAAPAVCAAQATTQPAYTPVRYNEDYSYLKDPANRTDFFDPIKYVPLNDKGDVYLSLGGQFRERYEYFENANFGVGIQDEGGYFLHRLMAHADLHVGPNVRGFVQLYSALEDRRDPEPRPQDVNEFDVHQAFLDLKVPLGDKSSVTFRGGRQNLLYGAQRVIGPLDWTNVRRTFDGGKASVAFATGSAAHTLDLFVVQPLIIERETADWHDSDQLFWGVYDTIALPEVLPKAGTRLEVYGLVLNQYARPARPSAEPPVGAIAVDSDTYTVGARFSTNPKPWDLDVEAAYQFGEFGDGDISAWSLALEGGYTFDPVPLKPRVYLGFDVASGDDDPADPDKQTYNQLFPTGHLFFGYIDVIGRQNIVDLHPGVELALLGDKPWAKKLSLRTDYHMFWRESDDDAVYNAAGGVQRADGGSDETYIGSEIDLLLNWQIDRHLSAYFGYSHFFPGDFIQATGPAEDIDFVYAAVQFIF